MCVSMSESGVAWTLEQSGSSAGQRLEPEGPDPRSAPDTCDATGIVQMFRTVHVTHSVSVQVNAGKVDAGKQILDRSAEEPIKVFPRYEKLNPSVRGQHSVPLVAICHHEAGNTLTPSDAAVHRSSVCLHLTLGLRFESQGIRFQGSSSGVSVRDGQDDHSSRVSGVCHVFPVRHTSVFSGSAWDVRQLAPTTSPKESAAAIIWRSTVLLFNFFLSDELQSGFYLAVCFLGWAILTDARVL